MSVRSEFPVLERIAYMNAGTDGPVPRRGLEAAQQSLREQTERGRAGKQHFERVNAMRGELRERAAALMNAAAADVALTHSTTDGMNLVLHGLRLARGDQVVTTDEEHPGLLAPLAALERERGIELVVAPFAEIANAITSDTKLVACSHVSWVGGKLVDTAALRASGVPILYDGAQGLGAIPVDVQELGCAFYAAAGQKWLCGPDQSGYLYVHPDHVERLGAPWPGYQSLSDASRAAELPLADGAPRFDLGFPAPHDAAWALAAFRVFDDDGWPATHASAAALAARLVDELHAHDREVAARGDTTLVAWRDPDPEALVERARAADVAVRYLPGRGLVRASIGAWNDENDLDRLLALVTSAS